ncbi:MAG: hypothetical protein GWN16_15295, partial [Calditrichae bacterium]|nr:hypothetical protein [Calditrichia bacterium]
FEIDTSKEDDSVEVAVDKDTGVLKIFSQSGIGSAHIKLVSGKMPKGIKLRFFLRGLEELRFSYNNRTITASVSSNNENQILQSMSRNEENAQDRRPLKPDSPSWMQIELFNEKVSSGNKIPIEEGYIEIAVPQHFLNNEFKEFSIHWIDFFRG